MALTEQWRKSTRSQQGSCVQARMQGDVVEIGDTKDSDGPTVRFDPAAWTTFLTQLREDAPAA